MCPRICMVVIAAKLRANTLGRNCTGLETANVLLVWESSIEKAFEVKRISDISL